MVDRDLTTPLLPAFHMYMVLNESYKAFAFSASKRVVAHNTHYAISLDHQDMANSSEAFCGKLVSQPPATTAATMIFPVPAVADLVAQQQQQLLIRASTRPAPSDANDLAFCATALQLEGHRVCHLRRLE